MCALIGGTERRTTYLLDFILISCTSSASASDAASLRLGLPVLAPLLSPRCRWADRGTTSRGWQRGRDDTYVYVCRWLRRKQRVTERQTGRDTEPARQPSERERNWATDTHWNEGMFTVVERRPLLYTVPVRRTSVTPDASLSPVRGSFDHFLQRHAVRDLRTRSQVRPARTKRGCQHVERTFALGRPELGFTTTVWVRFFPSARESRRRYHDDACAPPPIHPFPPGHFHSALARSLPARRYGALHERRRFSSYVVPVTPENPVDFWQILAPHLLPSLISCYSLCFCFLFLQLSPLFVRSSVLNALDTCSVWRCRSTGPFRHSTPKREAARLRRFQSRHSFVSQLRHTFLLACSLACSCFSLGHDGNNVDGRSVAINAGCFRRYFRRYFPRYFPRYFRGYGETRRE